MSLSAWKFLDPVYRYVSRGYEPEWPRPADVQLMGSPCSPMGDRDRAEIWLMLATHIAGADRLASIAQVENYLIRLIEAASVPAPIKGFIAIQHRNETEKLEAQQRANAFLEIAAKKGLDLRVMLLRSRRKLDSINALVDVAKTAEVNIQHLGWFDDDVGYQSDCIRNLVESACRFPDSAIGAKKIGLPRCDLRSRVLYRLKNFTRPAMNYPHGCALLAPWSAIKNGIPSRFSSDDGYICFELLNPCGDDPYENLRIVDDALVEHYVGAGPGKNRRRIRRMLLNHWILMCYYPEKSLCYIRTSLFWGFWPITKFSWRGGIFHGLARWFIKAIYFAMFASVGIELACRGILGRPLKTYDWN